MPPHKTVLVAALFREIGPLIKNWRRVEREQEGKRFIFFEGQETVAVCGGIGAQAARRAAEAGIGLYQPTSVWSVGFAGALDEAQKVGDIFVPNVVIDASDGSRTTAGGQDGALVTFSHVAGVEQKAKLATAYAAQGVDMEAGAVAKAAQKHDLEFRAVKVISDEVRHALPEMDRFIAPSGEFRTARFAAFVVLRPWMWSATIRLGRNTRLAAHELCDFLAERNES